MAIRYHQLTYGAVFVFTFLCLANAHTCEEVVSASLKAHFGIVLKCTEQEASVLKILDVWRPTSVNVTFSSLPGVQLTVYSASTLEELIDPSLKKRTLRWCKVFTRGCLMELPVPTSPSTIYVGAVKPLFTVAQPAYHVETRKLSIPMIVAVLAGCLLILYGAQMSKSMVIRVTGGGLAVGLIIGAIVLCWIRKMLGLRRTSLVGAAAGIFAWMAGLWMPSWNHLLNNTYLLGSLFGLWFFGALTVYVWGAGMNNPRLDVALVLVFRLLGLLLLYMGTWTNESLAFAVQILAWVYCFGPTVWLQRLWGMLSCSFRRNLDDDDSVLLEDRRRIHPLVVDGFIWNPLRVAIPIDGPEFRDLLTRGYEPNVYSGRMEKLVEDYQ
ncbi:hypothetical protein Vafri_4126 [Volvox africanus]|uniref:DUF4203 domain-containing protein n=1 Tax=Volvox africanus TaxID=51714 RepID=A0A8J4AX01_9CHLO|nr:hypothetical protein Vafri_4126 [Volvox africanus]